MYPTPCSNSIFFCLICLRDTEAWTLELSISIFFENFMKIISSHCVIKTVNRGLNVFIVGRDKMWTWSEIEKSILSGYPSCILQQEFYMLQKMFEV